MSARDIPRSRKCCKVKCLNLDLIFKMANVSSKSYKSKAILCCCDFYVIKKIGFSSLHNPQPHLSSGQFTDIIDK